MKSRRHGPSPAMVVAFVALLIGLSGTAVALPGKNKVKKDDIAAGAVSTSDLGNGAVNNRKLRNRSITANKVKLNSLGGGVINETALGKVPSAATADAAVTANTANTANTAGTAERAGSANSLATQRKISFQVTGLTAAQEIYNDGKLRLTAECSAAGDLTLTAATLVNNAAIMSYGNGSDTTEENFLAAAPVTLSDDDEERDVVYTEPGGGTTVLQFLAAEGAPFGTANSCLVRGLAQTL